MEGKEVRQGATGGAKKGRIMETFLKFKRGISMIVGIMSTIILF
jgi:hypothetical protein